MKIAGTRSPVRIISSSERLIDVDAVAAIGRRAANKPNGMHSLEFYLFRSGRLFSLFLRIYFAFVSIRDKVGFTIAFCSYFFLCRLLAVRFSVCMFAAFACAEILVIDCVECAVEFAFGSMRCAPRIGNERHLNLWLIRARIGDSNSADADRATDGIAKSHTRCYRTHPTTSHFHKAKFN